MSGNVVANQADITKLKQQLEQAGSDYKSNYAKLDRLVQQITNGEFKGQPADTFKSLYESKRDIFDKVQQSINEAEGYVDDELKKFVNLTNNLMDNMK